MKKPNLDFFSNKIAAAKEYVYQKFYREKAEAEQRRKKLIYILTAFFVLIIILIIFLAPLVTYQTIYKDKIYAGVFINGINVSGLTPGEALSKLNKHVDNLKQTGIDFFYKKEKLNVGLLVVSPNDPDLAYQILGFENELMIEQAYGYGRDQIILTDLLNQFKALVYNKQIDLVYNLNEIELLGILKNMFSKFEDPSEKPKLVFEKENKYKITQDKSGFEIDYQTALDEIKSSLSLISINPIELKTLSSVPEVNRSEVERIRPEIDFILKKELINFQFNDKAWEIKQEEFRSWLDFIKDDEGVKIRFLDESLNNELITISQEIDIVPQDAKLLMENDKVTEFEAHKMGLSLNIERSNRKINKEFFVNKKTDIVLIVDEKDPEVKTHDVNNFGITEIIGVGESDFSGSSRNRIGNITTASKKLHGMLIEPDQEFSLVDAIGDVTAATGYFPEYVIKGDRTIPEYGGGLCQIATTTFRAALYTGLPITERKPHSYVVGYYNPIGMDAAIYGPHPDVRFINDTGNYILFQTEMDGTKLTFTFWGKTDGRKVEITDPENYNWHGPGAAKIIENPNLAPGEKKLIERAKSGADAHFYRYITRPGQEKEEEIWRSHYTAWRAIYEVGVVASEGEEGEEGGDSSSEQPIETSESNDSE